MSSKNYKADGYGHELNHLALIVMCFVLSYKPEMGAEREVSE